MAEPEPPQACRVTPDRRRADEWSLALASAGIESRLDWGPSGYVLLVRAAERPQADAVLAAFDAENQPRAAIPDASGPDRAHGAIVLAVLLCAFFVVTGPRSSGSVWFERGSAVAARVAAGEPWRCVTALTLHADFPHIVSNAITLLLFGPALCGLLGTGVAVWLMLLSGTAGNWVTAVVRGAPYGAVGASTAIFGALGGLATAQVVRRRRGAAVSTWRAWAPIAAGLGLLGFLGTSTEADVLAHLFGFVFGAGLGVIAIRLEALRDRTSVQAALSIAALVVVLICWVIALASLGVRVQR